MRLVQLLFGGGTMPEEMTMVTIVLLLKGKGGYWRIGVVEVLWKVCSIFVNCCLKRGVVLYDAPSWVQGRAWDRDGYLGGQFGTASVRICT